MMVGEWKREGCSQENGTPVADHLQTSELGKSHDWAKDPISSVILCP